MLAPLFMAAGDIDGWTQSLNLMLAVSKVKAETCLEEMYKYGKIFDCFR